MPFLAVNNSKQDKAFRDDIGKHVVKPGEKQVIAGNQHWKACVAQGFDVPWVEPRDMQDIVADPVEVGEVIVEGDVGDHEEIIETTTPKRKASVKVSED